MNYLIQPLDPANRIVQIDWSFTVPNDDLHISFYQQSSKFGNRLRELKAHDNRNKSVFIRRTSPDRWKVSAFKGTKITISYKIHAFALDPYENYISEETWIIQPISACMTIVNLDTRPCSIILYPLRDYTFHSTKPIEDDIEGKVVSFDSYEQMIQYPITCFHQSHIKDVRIEHRVYRLVSKTPICESILPSNWNVIDADNTIRDKIIVTLYSVPIPKEKRGLEYGSFVSPNGVFIVANEHDIETKEALLFSVWLSRIMTVILPSNSWAKSELSFFSFGLARYLSLKDLELDLSELRKRIERYYIRTFSIPYELEENVLDSSLANKNTFYEDKGYVICHQLDLLFSTKDKKLTLFLDTPNQIEISEQLRELLEENYGERLDWFWKLAVEMSEQYGFFALCQTFLANQAWKLEKPKRGPVKLA